MAMRAVSTTQTSNKAVLEIQKLYEAAKSMYAPGGDYMKGTEAGLERGRKRAVSSGMANLAAAGLGSTSMVGSLGMAYEEDVAAPTRAAATSARVGALAGIMQSQAGAYAQLAPRTTYAQQSQARYPSSGPATPAFPKVPGGTTSQPSLQLYKQPTAPKPAAKKAAPKTTGLPSEVYSAAKKKTYDPKGTWQGTIGGTSFYSDGMGGFAKK